MFRQSFAALTTAALLSVAPLTAAHADETAEIKAMCAKVVGSGVHSFSLQEAYDLLKKEGYQVSGMDDDSFKIKYNGRTLVMFRFKDGDFQLYYGISGIKVDYKTINEWNRTKRLSRAYIDRVGDPVVESDQLGDAGLTDKQMLRFFKTFADITVPKFRQFVIEKGE